jgi:hypothetical protein
MNGVEYYSQFGEDRIVGSLLDTLGFTVGWCFKGYKKIATTDVNLVCVTEELELPAGWGP